MFDWFRYRPFDTGFLPEEDGYKIFYQQIGNPNGTPVIIFNGGPGYPNDPRRTRYFDFKKNRMIFIDQRGTGGSINQNGDVTYKNTTNDLLDDAKKVIEHLGIERKVVSAGTSWGATLALLFAQKYPDMVGKVISIATFSASKKYSSGWFENNTRLFYPDIIETLREQSGSDNFISYFSNLLFSGDKDKERQAVLFYGSYEEMLGQKDPKFNVERDVSEWEINRLKIALHYDMNDYFLLPNQILNDMTLIKDIPILMMHNRMDFVCPVEQAWDIHKNHPKSELHITPCLGHGEKVMCSLPKKLVKEFLQDF